MSGTLSGRLSVFLLSWIGDHLPVGMANGRAISLEAPFLHSQQGKPNGCETFYQQTFPLICCENPHQISPWSGSLNETSGRPIGSEICETASETWTCEIGIENGICGWGIETSCLLTWSETSQIVSGNDVFCCSENETCRGKQKKSRSLQSVTTYS